MSELNIGDKVVRLNRKTKNKIWKVVGISNVFAGSYVCESDDELLNHFHAKELRKPTIMEIQNNRRID